MIFYKATFIYKFDLNIKLISKKNLDKELRLWKKEVKTISVSTRRVPTMSNSISGTSNGLNNHLYHIIFICQCLFLLFLAALYNLFTNVIVSFSFSLFPSLFYKWIIIYNMHYIQHNEWPSGKNRPQYITCPNLWNSSIMQGHQKLIFEQTYADLLNIPTLQKCPVGRHYKGQ